MFSIIGQSELRGQRKRVSSEEVARAADAARAERHLARVKDKALQDYLLNVR